MNLFLFFWLISGIIKTYETFLAGLLSGLRGEDAFRANPEFPASSVLRPGLVKLFPGSAEDSPGFFGQRDGGLWNRSLEINARVTAALACVLFLAGLGIGWNLFWKAAFLPEEFGPLPTVLRFFGWAILAFALLIGLVEVFIFIRGLRGREPLSSQANQFFMLNYVFVSAAVWFVSFPLMMLVCGIMFGGLPQTQDKIISALGKQKERIEVLEKKVGQDTRYKKRSKQ